MALSTTRLLSVLKQRGYSFFSGVPCSNFVDLFQQVSRVGGFIDAPAANEGSAISFAAGATLTGRKSVVALQNSGLGNVINPLTSLLQINRIPALLFISVRGHPDEAPDEPQHSIMGERTSALLDAISVDWCEFGGTEENLAEALSRAEAAFARDACFAILFRKGQLLPASEARNGGAGEVGPAYPMSAGMAIEAIGEHLRPTDLIVSTTGFISRELFRLRDRPGNFYMQGSLGHCSAVAAGIAVSHPACRVLALDGDGAVLMHMGVLSTIASMAPANFLHIVLDNEGYVSTGGQATSSGMTALEQVALFSGYRTASRCDDERELRQALEECLLSDGPHFILCKVNAHFSAQLPRVTARHTPVQNKEAFRSEVSTGLAEGAARQTVPLALG
jgi:phosphonopyruvate decarboxylase